MKTHVWVRWCAAFGLVLALGASWTLFARQESARPDRERIATAPAIQESARASFGAWRDLVHDATSEERLLLESAAIELASRELVASDARLGGRALDAATCTDLRETPAPHRGLAYVGRGTLEELEPLTSTGARAPDWRGRLTLEDNAGPLWFLLSQGAETAVAAGDLARLDGVFVKNFERASSAGRIAAPLLLASRLVPSVPRRDFPPPPAAEVLSAVVDDRLGEPPGEIELEAQLTLLAWSIQALPLDPGKVAPDRLDLADSNGRAELVPAARGALFQLEPMRVLGAWSVALEENPLRIDRLSELWLGAVDADGVTRAAKLVSALDLGPLSEGTLAECTARYLRQESYTARDGSPALAPVFVLVAYSTVSQTVWDQEALLVLAIAVAGCLLILVGLVAWLRARLLRGSTEIGQEFDRRRRARREHAQGA